MKSAFAFLLVAFVAGSAIAQTAPSPAPAAPVAAPVASPAPIAASVPDTAPAPVMVKDINAAPPTWVQDLAVSIKSLPVVGPIVVKALNWIAVIVSILTALCAFLMVALKALSSIMNIASLTNFAASLQAFQDGKIMYYLKYFSAFNAQKPDPQPADVTKAA